MKKTLVIFTVLFLAACATDELATRLPQIEGRPIGDVLSRLGPPSEKTMVDGQTMYTWVHTESGTYSVPGAVNSPVGIDPRTQTMTYSRSDIPYAEQSYAWTCRLDITSAKGVVTHTQYDGNALSCHVFSEKLKPLIEEKR